MKITKLLFIAFLPSLAFAQVFDFKTLTTKQVKELDKEKTIILIPGGLMEEHGPYLPLYTDGYTNESLAKRIADSLFSKTKFVVLIFPTIPLGVGSPESFGGMKTYPGVVYLRPATLRSVFMDIGDMLGRQGFKWIFVVFKHGATSHNRSLIEASDYFNDHYIGKMAILSAIQYDTWAGKFPQLTQNEKDENGIDIHAGMDETSRMLLNKPDLVDPGYKNARPFPARSMDDFTSITSSTEWLGYYGSPRLATVEIGQAIMERFTHNYTDLAIKIIHGFNFAHLPRTGDTDPPDLSLRKGDATTRELAREFEIRQKHWMQGKGIID